MTLPYRKKEETARKEKKEKGCSLMWNNIEISRPCISWTCLSFVYNFRTVKTNQAQVLTPMLQWTRHLKEILNFKKYTVLSNNNLIPPSFRKCLMLFNFLSFHVACDAALASIIHPLNFIFFRSTNFPHYFSLILLNPL